MTVFCTNCYLEWFPSELKLKFSEDSNQIIAFCPECNCIEFMSADDYLSLTHKQLIETEKKSDNYEKQTICKENIIYAGGK